MNNKLYVGNLSFRVSSEDLQSLFGEVGSVESARVIEDRETGRSRGFGFVEMATADEAANAIDKFNGMDYEGRNMAVKEAQPREDRGGGGGGGRRNNYNGDGGGGGRW
ncbi:MAG TPA: RNA-binding protein [Pyrinomonadaceae bacterium]|jgi:RNA recognition motif-containing protein|nr:RNA-binding protein [Pyrinomonadaceae bacterium]